MVLRLSSPWESSTHELTSWVSFVKDIGENFFSGVKTCPAFKAAISCRMLTQLTSEATATHVTLMTFGHGTRATTLRREEVESKIVRAGHEDGGIPHLGRIVCDISRLSSFLLSLRLSLHQSLAS